MKKSNSMSHLDRRTISKLVHISSAKDLTNLIDYWWNKKSRESDLITKDETRQACIEVLSSVLGFNFKFDE